MVCERDPCAELSVDLARSGERGVDVETRAKRLYAKMIFLVHHDRVIAADVNCRAASRTLPTHRALPALGSRDVARAAARDQRSSS